MTILKAVDLYKDYVSGDNKTNVLKDINLEIQEGRFISIMGQSGSGKSTLLYVLSGLEKPTKGSIVFDGQDLSKMKDEKLSIMRRKSFGFVFQFYNLIPTLTVEENITLPLELDGVKKKLYKDNLDKVLNTIGLIDKRKSFPYQLSGGQQQRVAIGRALITDPKIVFADEPTGNLDSKTGEEILQLLKQLSTEKGKTILMVTHDNNAASYTDTTINIRDGKIM